MEIDRDQRDQRREGDRAAPRALLPGDQPPRSEAGEHGQADGEDRADPGRHAHAPDRREPVVADTRTSARSALGTDRTPQPGRRRRPGGSRRGAAPGRRPIAPAPRRRGTARAPGTRRRAAGRRTTHCAGGRGSSRMRSRCSTSPSGCRAPLSSVPRHSTAAPAEPTAPPRSARRRRAGVTMRRLSGRDTRSSVPRTAPA